MFSGQRAMDEFTDNLNPENLLQSDVPLRYNTLSDFIDMLNQKAEFLADGHLLGIDNQTFEGGNNEEMDTPADNTSLMALEMRQDANECQ